MKLPTFAEIGHALNTVYMYWFCIGFQVGSLIGFVETHNWPMIATSIIFGALLSINFLVRQVFPDFFREGHS